MKQKIKGLSMKTKLFTLLASILMMSNLPTITSNADELYQTPEDAGYAGQKDWSWGYSANEQTYTIQQDGYYEFNVYGAQGGNAGRFSGGQGGTTSFTILLKKGQVVSIQTGTKGYDNGSGGAGGGSATIIKVDNNIITIAAGGGGASLNASKNKGANGGAGGDTSGSGTINPVTSSLYLCGDTHWSNNWTDPDHDGCPGAWTCALICNTCGTETGRVCSWCHDIVSGHNQHYTPNPTSTPGSASTNANCGSGGKGLSDGAAATTSEVYGYCGPVVHVGEDWYDFSQVHGSCGGWYGYDYGCQNCGTVVYTVCSACQNWGGRPSAHFANIVQFTSTGGGENYISSDVQNGNKTIGGHSGNGYATMKLTLVKRQAKVVVNHYRMNIYGNGYDLYETKNYWASPGKSFYSNIYKADYAGFTFDGGKFAASTNIKPNSFDSVYTIAETDLNKIITLNIYYTRNKYTLDYNPVLDGTTCSGGYKTADGQKINISKADVYLYGKKVATDVSDYCNREIYYEAPYKIVIKANPGFTHSGKNEIYSGTIAVDGSYIQPNFTTNVYKITLNKDKAVNQGTSAIYLKYTVGYFNDAACSNKISKITIPSRDGWHFYGYYMDQQKLYNQKDEGTGTKYIDSSGNILTNTIQQTSNSTVYAYMRDKTAPNVSISYKTSDNKEYELGTWTNKTVTATVTATDNGTGIQGYKWIKIEDDSEEWLSDTTWTTNSSKSWNKDTVTTYGTVSVADNGYEAGYWKNDNVTIIDVASKENKILIDKIKPYFGTEKPSYKVTKPHDVNLNTNVKGKTEGIITMPGKDDYSGVYRYLLTTTSSTPSTSDAKWQESNQFKVTDNGYYYCWIMDKALNISDEYKIYIDFTAPTMKDIYTTQTHKYRITYAEGYSKDYNVQRIQLNSDKVFYYPWVNGNFRLHFTATDENLGTGIKKMAIHKGGSVNDPIVYEVKWETGDYKETRDIDYVVRATENEGTQLWTIQVWDRNENTSYIKVATRIDYTAPVISDASEIYQPKIEDIKLSQIEDFLNNADNFNTTYKIVTSDYKSTVVTNDTSGLETSYINVIDTSDSRIHKIYVLDETAPASAKAYTNNSWENSRVKSFYTGSHNLYVDFPDSTNLGRFVLVADISGNLNNNGKQVNLYKYILPSGGNTGSDNSKKNTDPYGFEKEGPYDPYDPTAPNHVPSTPEKPGSDAGFTGDNGGGNGNGSTALPDDPKDRDDDKKNPYDNDSDGGKDYTPDGNGNHGNGDSTKLPDGNGLPDSSDGYPPAEPTIPEENKTSQNFSIMTYIVNDESTHYNLSGDTGNVYFQLGEKGHVIVYTIGYVQRIQLDFMSMGEESGREIDSGLLSPQYNMGTPSGSHVRYIDYTKGTKMGPIPDNKNGVPFAVKYEIPNEWGSNGTAILIPPYYEMQDDTSKQPNEDGSYPKKWELRYYKAIAHKTNSETGEQQAEFDKNSYILWGTHQLDIHYRVTHES